MDLYASRVFLHDTNGVPTLVDLAAMRDAIAAFGGDPARVNPVIASELVIDHSVIADVHGRPDALVRNVELEYARNGERYRFLRWGQQSLKEFAVVPPGTGIMHQVNLEHLARVVMTEGELGVPGRVFGHRLPYHHGQWARRTGLGHRRNRGRGSHAGAVDVDQRPGCCGGLPSRCTPGRFNSDRPCAHHHRATSRLRRHRQVRRVRRAGRVQPRPCNRATIANMSPEFGATCALFPIDDETLRYLRLTGRGEGQVNLVEAYAKAQGLWHDPQRELRFDARIEIDLGDVVPVIRGSVPARGPGPDESGKQRSRQPSGTWPAATMARAGPQRLISANKTT